MFKAVAPKGAYIFDRIISSYINIGSISLLLLSSLNDSHILQLTGAGFKAVMIITTMTIITIVTIFMTLATVKTVTTVTIITTEDFDDGDNCYYCDNRDECVTGAAAGSGGCWPSEVSVEIVYFSVTRHTIKINYFSVETLHYVLDQLWHCTVLG